MIKKWLNFIIPAALAVSPLAIIASCNNNETTNEPVEEDKPQQPVVNLDLNTRIESCLLYTSDAADERGWV